MLHKASFMLNVVETVIFVLCRSVVEMSNRGHMNVEQMELTLGFSLQIVALMTTIG